MKKLLSIFLFLFLGIFLATPRILSLSLHHSIEHGGENNCVTHCMLEVHTSFQDIAQALSFGGEIFLVKITHGLFQDIYFSTVLLFFVLIFAPPNLWRYIKNYYYSLLIGVVKLTT